MKMNAASSHSLTFVSLLIDLIPGYFMTLPEMVRLGRSLAGDWLVGKFNDDEGDDQVFSVFLSYIHARLNSRRIPLRYS